MDRRKFLRHSSALAAIGILPISSLKAFMPDMDKVGIQLFSIPKMLNEDFVGALTMLSELGYSEIELFGPYSFSAQSAKDQWAAIGQMLGFTESGLFGLEGSEVKSIMNDLGLTTPSVHTDLDTLETKMEELAAAAELLGYAYVCLPAIPDPLRQTMDDYRRMAERFNKIGENALSHGLKFAYHNHGYGLQEVDGIVPLQLIFDETDADKVFFEMDIFWTAGGKADPVEYLRNYPGRYKLMHIKDMREAVTFSGDGSTSDQWFALFPYMTSAGEGVMDLESIVAVGKETGVDHFLVEQDLVQNPETALKKSIDYLGALE